MSEAAALMVIAAGAMKVAPLVGLVMLTVGRVFGALTVILTALDVVTAPKLSVALAVSE